MYGLKDNNVQLIINADVIEDGAKAQVDSIAKHPALTGLVSIMPDVHFGKGCVIGFTGRFKNAVIPNIVGVDLGCGVTTYTLGDMDIDFEALDKHIRKEVPLGFNRHKGTHHLNGLVLEEKAMTICSQMENIFEANEVQGTKSPHTQMGTLGGGNHFVEIEEANGEKYLTVHSGSRHGGLKIANHFQAMAKKITDEMYIQVPQGLEYLPMSRGGDAYLQAVDVAQEYAAMNRRVMIEKIIAFFDMEYDEDKVIESVHNYIDASGIIRKGAISAKQGEEVIIPFNMAQGIAIGLGKSNSKYNFSAPHGAGRTSGRKAMQRKLASGEVTMAQFHEAMAGVYSTSISPKTIDESPFVYKKFEDIEKHLRETVDITVLAKPIYNLKSE